MLNTAEALEYMTQEQMMMTRQRQIVFELDKDLAREEERELDSEYWALQSILREGERIEGRFLKGLKNAIKSA